jgi:hypothetical protein
MNYQQAAHTYLRSNLDRQQAYFKFLNDNWGNDVNLLAERFLKAEYLQRKCPHFKVNP